MVSDKVDYISEFLNKLRGFKRMVPSACNIISSLYYNDVYYNGF